MKLPEDLNNLINLRHISINIGSLIRSLYKDSLLKNMGRLTCRQTLKFLVWVEMKVIGLKKLDP